MTPDPGHSLYLGIDLQVETLLFTVAAAVREAPDEALPWRRWLAEDLEAVVALAQDAVRRRVPLPATLAPERDSGAVRRDLAARYRAMVDLLDDVPGPDGDAQRLRSRYAERLGVLP